MSELQHEPTCAYYGLEFKTGSANKICSCPGRAVTTDQEENPLSTPCIHCGVSQLLHGSNGACLKAGYYGNHYTAPEPVIDVTRAERIAAEVGLPRDEPVVQTAIRQEKAEQARVKVPRVNFTQLDSQREYSTAHYALGRLHEAGYRDGYRAGHRAGKTALVEKMEALAAEAEAGTDMGDVYWSQQIRAVLAEMSDG